MVLPAILSKVKALAPVAVVGGAVAITIKLLTQESTPNSQILKVDAEEDIKTTEFEEQLEEEQPEEEKEEEEEASDPVQEAEEAEEDAEQQEEEQDADGSDSSDSKEEEENKKGEKQEDEKEKPKLTFKDGGLGDILKEIFKSD